MTSYIVYAKYNAVISKAKSDQLVNTDIANEYHGSLPALCDLVLQLLMCLVIRPYYPVGTGKFEHLLKVTS